MAHGGSTETPEERLEENLKSPYPHHDGTNWSSLINTFATEFTALETTRDTVLDSVVVDRATGAQLDRLGEVVQLPRQTNETDPHYRGRLKVQLKKYIGGATIDEIKETAAILLDTNASEIAIEEDFATEAARFTIQISDNALDEAEVTANDFRTFVDEVRGAGIKALAEERGTFTYRSAQDYSNGTNDPTKGYYDSTDGVENGTYSGLL